MRARMLTRAKACGREAAVWIRLTRAGLATLTAAGGIATGALAVTAPAYASGPPVPVIVGYTPAAGPAAAEAAVRAYGGTVTRRLDIASSVAATVPSGALSAVARAFGVGSVTRDGAVKLAGAQWKPDDAVNSMYSITKNAGVHDVWAKSDSTGKKLTGKGIGVALIDSGISPIKGLAGTGKVINGPDLSFESQTANLRNLDTFGHGTHLAGIIAGRDPEVTAGNENDSKYFVGVAPDATLLNMKVATTDGAVDVSQVIAAIDWVVTNRNNGMNIRVINLSFGTDSTQDPRFDPLSHAVEAAWRKGIVVVVAAGNDGSTATRLGMPAMNPYVIAVGAADPKNTETRTDDIVAAFSSRGSTTRKPDLVAAGKSVVSLRTPKSYIDTNYPAGLVPGDASLRFFRGSGTSQSAAVVSGAAALLLQQRPTLTPDQVKRLLMTTTDAMPYADSIARGAGQLNVKRAAETATPVYSQTFLASQGTGTLEGARGTAHVMDPDTGVELFGEKDIMGKAWGGGTWAPKCLTGTAWTGGTYNGSVWAGGAWTTNSTGIKTWTSATWAGSSWSGRTWSGRTWSSAVWDGRTWSSGVWSGRTWSGRLWSGDYWSGTDWK